MKIESHRCKHCQVVYYYRISGNGCLEKLNDSSYCPDCMEILLEAFKNIPVKYQIEWLPIIPGTKDLSKDEFINFIRDKLYFITIKEFTGYKNISLQSRVIKKYFYRLYTNIDSEEELFMMGYEVDTLSNEITGIWGNDGIPFTGNQQQVEEARKCRKEFFDKGISLFYDKKFGAFVDVVPMKAPDDKIFYAQAFYGKKE